MATLISVVATLVSVAATEEPEITICSENKIIISPPCNLKIYEKTLDSILWLKISVPQENNLILNKVTELPEIVENFIFYSGICPD